MDRYRFNDGNIYEYGTLIKLEPDKLTIRMDNGEIRTAPPYYPQYIGIISERQLKKILKSLTGGN